MDRQELEELKRDELVDIAKDMGLSFHHKLGQEKLIDLILSSVDVEESKDENKEADSLQPVEPEVEKFTPEVPAKREEVKLEKKKSGKAKPPSRYNKFKGVN